MRQEVMTGEIDNRLRHALFGEIVGRGDKTAVVRRQTPRHKGGIVEFGNADGDIKRLANNIDKTVCEFKIDR